MSNKVCLHCNHPLLRIDHYGEELIGCIHCNRWGHGAVARRFGGVSARHQQE
jgi:hypothetical protein